MFVVKKHSTFKAEVEFNYPDGEKMTRQKFTAEYLLLPQSELEEIAKDGKRTNREIIGKVVKSVDGISASDEGGDVAEGELLDVLSDDPIVSNALVQTYYRTVLGAAAKN